ncbi:MAG: carboxylesterase/lipase family protein [Pseudomonadales bacterium]|nr:carboxylesterase/lipase family protein [Pseudomonadales bacterium]
MSDITLSMEAKLFPVVETAEGKLRGVMSGGVATFKGVHYGASTSGRNRFRPPQPVTPWTGIRDAMDYGQISPQVPADRRRAYADLIFNDLQPGGMGEDCLVLNLWSAGLPGSTGAGAAGKPVLIRFHGGGFYGGSANSPGMDGEMLARFGDCVVITVNHRLSALGYLYLGDDGEFADSGAAGILDLVAALEWVQRNVAAFGGDPDCVMIFGQSGGGAKVSHLMAMPAASGLFHRAIIMSGARVTASKPESAQVSADQFLKVLGLTAKDTDKLQTLPWATLVAAQAEVEAGDRARGEAPRSFAPCLGRTIPRHPFAPDAPEISAHIPLIVSSTLDERTYREAGFDMTWEDLRKALLPVAGERCEEVLAMYRDDDPGATPYILNARIITDRGFRRNARLVADRKAERASKGGAPVWSYLWAAPSPAFGGRYGATHAVDVSYAMHDTRMALSGPQENNVRLADELASSFVAFAHNGDPDNPITPHWQAYDTAQRQTLVFGNPSRQIADPRGVFADLWDSLG